MPFDKEDEATLTDGVLEAPLETAYWNDQLVAAPFWANTQLLWFRKSAAEAAGVDPAAPDFTWDQMIKAAESQQKVIGVQANRYEGYMVWINALVVSAGGEIIGNVEAGKDATPEINSPAGDAAAEIVGGLARSPAAPPAMSTAGEEEARSAFQGDRGMFMVNWPYVYGAARASRERRHRAVGRRRHRLGPIPRGRGRARRASRRWAGSTWPSAPTPSTRSRRSTWSSASPRCRATSSTWSTPATRRRSGAAYDDPKVRKAFPMAVADP